MGEDARLFIGQGIRVMAGDKPVGFAKEGMMTCSIKGGSLQSNPDAIVRVSGKDIEKNMAAYVRRKQSKGL